jgi:hypothetical protein
MNTEANGRKIRAYSNIYTVLLSLAVGVTAATAGLVAFMCWFRYETLFKITEVLR